MIFKLASFTMLQLQCEYKYTMQIYKYFWILENNWKKFSDDIYCIKESLKKKKKIKKKNVCVEYSTIS